MNYLVECEILFPTNDFEGEESNCRAIWKPIEIPWVTMNLIIEIDAAIALSIRDLRIDELMVEWHWNRLKEALENSKSRLPAQVGSL